MNESPFTKTSVKIGREQGTFEKLQESTQQFVHDSFVDAIPSDDIKQLPPRYLYPSAWILFIALMFTFVAIFLYGYDSAISQQFLSPSSQHQYKPDDYCETIQTINTGEYMCMQTGVWQGQSDFVYADAGYNLILTSFSVSYKAYQNYMNDIYDALVKVGNIASVSGLTTNLIYWMALKFVLSGNAAQSFQSVATPLNVFKRQKTAGMVSNVQADCSAPSEASFDSSSGLMTVTYSYDDFINTPSCISALNPTWFNYLPDVNSDTFSIQFDIRTLTTVVAVEAGILDLNSITEISTYQNNFTYNGEVFTVKKYIDDAYPNMAPMSCIFDETDGFACIMQVSSYIIAYPLFNHAGSNKTVPQPCDCSTLTTAELNDRQSPCNLFNLLTGFIFFNSDSYIPMLNFMERYSFDMTPVNLLAFNSSFVASYYGQSSIEYDSVLNTPEYRTSIYEYCNNCSLVTFTSFDIIQTDWSINEYYYQLENGACRNTFTTSYDDWQLLIETPFSSLNEQYEKCHNDPTTVLFNQLGVSIGNVAIAIPLCIIFVLGLLSLYSMVFNVNIPKSYSKNDKERALNAFAIGLLLARDNQWTNSSSQENMNSVMLKLTEELSNHADQSNHHYNTRTEDEQGIAWLELLKKATGRKKSNSIIKSPMHLSRKRSTVTPPTTPSIAAANGVDVEMGRGSSILDKTELLRLLSDPRITVLNKPSETVLNEMVMEWISVTDMVVKIIECIAGFASIPTEESGGYKNSIAYWTQAAKPVCFCSMRLLFCSNDERRFLYSKLEDLVVIHTSVLMNCAPEKVFELYGEKMAYCTNEEVLVLSEIRRRATGGTS